MKQCSQRRPAARRSTLRTSRTADRFATAPFAVVSLSNLATIASPAVTPESGSAIYSAIRLLAIATRFATAPSTSAFAFSTASSAIHP